jgi:Flp pilus assembly protein TadD
VDEFVVCPACGTRIKAGREFCLRCFEPLPTADRPIRLPRWVSLELSDRKKLIVGGIAVAIAATLVAAIVMTDARSVVDHRAAPSSTSGSPATIRSVPIFELTPASGGESSALSPADTAALESKRSEYEAELAKRPDNADLLSNLGQVLEQLGRPSDAVPRFERAIALAPDTATFHSNLAHASSVLGLSSRAISEYREAARLRPDDSMTHYTLALTLHTKGDDAAAIPEFQKAIALSPNDASAHLLLGISLETVGRFADAVQEYRRYLTIQPTSADAERLKVHVLALAGGQP